MSIATVVLDTPDANSVATLPITLEEAVVAVVSQVDRAQDAADQASLRLTETTGQAGLAEASRLAALVSQTAAAGSAAAAAATLASVGPVVTAARDAAIVDIEATRDAAIAAVEGALDVPPPVEFTPATASATLVVGKQYSLDATTGTITLTLPASPAEGDSIRIIDGGTIGSGPTYIVARNGNTIGLVAEDVTLDVVGLDVIFRFKSGNWRLF